MNESVRPPALDAIRAAAERNRADILATPDEDFGKAAADVVRKFEELYRRLA